MRKYENARRSVVRRMMSRNSTIAPRTTRTKHARTATPDRKAPKQPESAVNRWRRTLAASDTAKTPSQTRVDLRTVTLRAF